MLRLAIVLVFSALLVGCLSGLGDRLLQVRVQPVSEQGRKLSNCMLSLKGDDTHRVIGQRELHPGYLISFVNPPQRGQYHFEIACAGRQGVFRSNTYDFSTEPYFHDLGEITIAK